MKIYVDNIRLTNKYLGFNLKHINPKYPFSRIPKDGVFFCNNAEFIKWLYLKGIEFEINRVQKNKKGEIEVINYSGEKLKHTIEGGFEYR